MPAHPHVKDLSARMSGLWAYTEKVGPDLLEIAGIYKEYVRLGEQLKNLPRERWKEVLGEPDAETDKRIEDELRQLFSATPPEQVTGSEVFFAGSLSALEKQPIQQQGDLAVLYEGVPNEPAANKDLLGLMEAISEQRFHQPLWQLILEDRAGVKESSEKIQRIIQDGHKLRYGEEIEPPKGNLDHRLIFEFGVGRGLENLTAEQLACFFDDFCPCGAETHDSDSLLRERKSLEKRRKAAIDWKPGGFDSKTK